MLREKAKGRYFNDYEYDDKASMVDFKHRMRLEENRDALEAVRKADDDSLQISL